MGGLDVPENPFWNRRKSHASGRNHLLNEPTLLVLLLTLVLLVNVGGAVDYQEEWEDEEADVSATLQLQQILRDFLFFQGGDHREAGRSSYCWDRGSRA